MSTTGRGCGLYDHRKHFVYQLWAGDKCLYVGCTVALGARLAEHGRKPWFEDVTHIEAKPYMGRWPAADKEAELIMAFQPRHNIQHTERNLGRSRAQA